MPFPLRAVALVMPQLASVAHLALAAGVCRAWRSVIGSEAEVSGRIRTQTAGRAPVGATHTAHCRLVSIGHTHGALPIAVAQFPSERLAGDLACRHPATLSAPERNLPASALTGANSGLVVRAGGE